VILFKVSDALVELVEVWAAQVDLLPAEEANHFRPSLVDGELALRVYELQPYLFFRLWVSYGSHALVPHIDGEVGGVGAKVCIQ